MSIIEALLSKIDGPLPIRKEAGEETYRLEISRSERNALSDLLSLELDRRSHANDR